MPSMSGSDANHKFQEVDWADVTRSRQWLTAPRVTFAVGVVVTAILFAYDRYVAHVYLISTWRVDPIDWVFLLGLVVLVAFGAVPAIKRWRSMTRYLRRLGARPATLFGAWFLGVFVIVGLIGPVVYPYPGLDFAQTNLPPVGFSTPVIPTECPGGITGEGFERFCQGSWDAPIGTNHRGFPMEFLLIEGARVALYVVVIGAAFVIPVAAITGVIAGLRGGLVDDLLMGYVDVQLSIPAIVVYFIGYIYWNPSLLLLLATFGLLSWGGIARLVRSEVLQRREDGHVMVARSLGASRLYIARRHILPNVTNTLVPAAFHLLALLVLIEAGVAFLGFHDIMLYSWGSTISEGINAEIAPQLIPRADVPTQHIWWVSTFPAVALTLTMVSLKLTGDGLRDALDPRREF
ncbi:MAG: ABC transporter permease [Halobacteriales archaeon]